MSKLILPLVAISCLLSVPLFGQRKSPFRPLPVPLKAAQKGFISDKRFSFTDSKGKIWVAPVGTKTDCASIPQVALSFIGDPCDLAYRNAALVHDAYCAEDNKGGSSYHQASWKDVHRMFYEACRAGGTPEIKAKVMFAAVWMFGPRDWAFTKTPNPGAMSNESREELEIRLMDVAAVSDSLKQQQFEELADFIEKENPDLNEIEFKARQSITAIQQNQKLVLPGGATNP